MHVRHALNPIAAIHPATSSAHDQNLSGGSRLLAELVPGQRVRATVQESLINAEFVVTLESEGAKALKGQVVRMTLPPGVRVGDRLNLVFIGREPRLQFALSEDLPSRGDVFRPSEAARFIDRLLRYPSLAGQFVNSPLVPLLSEAPDDPAELSLRLTQALERSGLFYESHLAQWVAGKRAFEELLLEPQAHPGGSRPVAPAALIDAQALKAAGFFPERGTILTDRGVTPDIVHDMPAPQDQFHSEGLALVRQQLDILETQQVTWQGEAWPGQQVTLEFFKEDPYASADSDRTDEVPGGVWKTCLRLTLPNLGKVTGNLRLNAQGLEINLSATSSATVATLRASTALLSQGLESGGISLLSMGVDLDEETLSE